MLMQCREGMKNKKPEGEKNCRGNEWHCPLAWQGGVGLPPDVCNIIPIIFN